MNKVSIEVSFIVIHSEGWYTWLPQLLVEPGGCARRLMKPPKEQMTADNPNPCQEKKDFANVASIIAVIMKPRKSWLCALAMLGWPRLSDQSPVLVEQEL